MHCCAPGVPVRLLRETGAAALAIDLDVVGDLDPLGEALDAGVGLIAGAADPRRPAPTSAEVADRVLAVWHRFGFPVAQAARQVAVAAACGLAGTSVGNARRILAACRDAGRRLAQEE
jgi:hypothetical protein